VDKILPKGQGIQDRAGMSFIQCTNPKGSGRKSNVYDPILLEKIIQSAEGCISISGCFRKMLNSQPQLKKELGALTTWKKNFRRPELEAARKKLSKRKNFCWYPKDAASLIFIRDLNEQLSTGAEVCMLEMQLIQKDHGLN
jgi:hypothetical protein